jgi:hypothetical protein
MKVLMGVGAVLLLIGSVVACAGGGSSPTSTPTARPLPSARPPGAAPANGSKQGTVKVISEDAPPPEGAPAATQTAPQVQVEERAQPAVNVAQEWIGVIDQGGYSASWSATGQPVRGAVTQEQWVSSLTSVRQPLGEVASRQLTAAQYTTTLQGAPEGQYVVIQYDTDFASAPDMVETVTAMLEPDGQWRVVGYLIKSAAEMQQQQQGQQPPAEGQQPPPPPPGA